MLKIRKILELIYPPRCIICDGLLTSLEDGVHEKCKKEIIFIKSPSCMQCGSMLEKEETEYCFDCRREQGKRFFRQGKSLFLYKGKMKETMYRFKYANRRRYACFFAKEVKRRYGDWIRTHKIEAIVAIPMHKKKQRKRGYNQAEVVGREIAKELGVAFNNDFLVRSKDTKPQKGLSDIERKNNLKNAFHIKRNVVKYRKILLVDDIYTTGSTADAAAKTLREAGVEEIYFLSICIGKGF